jgi:hypothetical protein
MPGLASLFRRTLFSQPASGSKPLQPLAHAAGRAGAPPDPPADQATLRHWSRPGPERLERIAAYARAGYFNLGYTYEMFHLAAELPPE